MTGSVGRRRAERFSLIGLSASAALMAVGCRDAPAATPSATASPSPPPATALSLDAYHERVSTAVAAWSSAWATVPVGPTAQARVRATAAALVGRPAAVRLRGGGPAGSAEAGTGPGRVMTAEALVVTSGSYGSYGSNGTFGSYGTNAPDGSNASDGSRGPTTPTQSGDPTPTPPPPPATEAAAIAARLTVVRDELGASRGDDTAARDTALARVLEDKAFRDRRSPWQQAWAWVSERVRRWLDDASLPAGTGEAALRIGQIVGWVAALVVMALTGVWIARTLAGLADSARVAGGAHAPPTTPAEARARAEAHAVSGDYRAAVRQLYLAALLVLEANGQLRADRSRTNREQLAAVAGNTALRSHMAAVVDTFDRVWYGVTVPDETTFRAYADAIHQLESLSLAGPAASGKVHP